MRVEFSPAATAELQNAADWYDRQREGLGEDFVDEVSRAVLLIEEAALRYPKYGRRSRYRRVRLSRFPYHVVYEVSDDVASIVAIAHERREPRYWKRRR